MEEQIETLKASARAYIMLVKAFNKNGDEISMRSYIKQAKECCEMAMELEKEWLEDITVEYLIAA